MNVAPGANPTVDSIQRVTSRKGAFVVEPPAVQVAVSAAIIQTYWNKGEMHEATISKIDTFNIP